MLVIVLAPHHNCRYQASIEQLSRAEIEMTLKCVDLPAEIEERIYAGHVTFCIDESACESKDMLFSLLSRLSSAYMICQMSSDGGLYPLFGRRQAYLGDDISGVLKYKGKTSETFTRLLLNVARLSGEFALSEQPLNVLDPVCGKGTTLLEAINAGDCAYGVDVDDKSLSELQTFLKRYLTFHHFKHKTASNSLTVLSKPKPIWELTTANTPEAFKAGNTRMLSLVNCDTLLTDKLVRKPQFHIIAGDLPYGVQHAPHASDKNAPFKPEAGHAQSKKNATIDQFTERAVPVWAKTLLPGGAMALSFNTYTLKRDVLRDQMRACGLDVMEGGAYDGMEHWVEQAVNRDIVVGVKRK